MTRKHRRLSACLCLIGALLIAAGAVLFLLTRLKPALGVALGGILLPLTVGVLWTKDGENGSVFFLAVMTLLFTLLLGLNIWIMVTAEEVYDLPMSTFSGTLAEDADYQYTRKSEWIDLTLEQGGTYTISETVLQLLDVDDFCAAAAAGAEVRLTAAQGHLTGDTWSIFGLEVDGTAWLTCEESLDCCAESDRTGGLSGIIICGIELPALLLLLLVRLRDRKREQASLF